MSKKKSKISTILSELKIPSLCGMQGVAMPWCFLPLSSFNFCVNGTVGGAGKKRGPLCSRNRRRSMRKRILARRRQTNASGSLWRALSGPSLVSGGRWRCENPMSAHYGHLTIVRSLYPHAHLLPRPPCTGILMMLASPRQDKMFFVKVHIEYFTEVVVARGKSGICSTYF